MQIMEFHKYLVHKLIKLGQDKTGTSKIEFCGAYAEVDGATVEPKV